MPWTRWQAGAAVLALAASAAVCVVPTVRSTSSSSGPGGDVVTEGSSTLLAAQGPGLLLVLLVPVLLTALPLRLGRWSSWAGTGALGVLVVLTGFSIGLAYLPALVAAGVGLVAREAGVLPVEQAAPGH